MSHISDCCSEGSPFYHWGFDVPPEWRILHSEGMGDGWWVHVYEDAGHQHHRVVTRHAA